MLAIGAAFVAAGVGGGSSTPNSLAAAGPSGPIATATIALPPAAPIDATATALPATDPTEAPAVPVDQAAGAAAEATPENVGPASDGAPVAPAPVEPTSTPVPPPPPPPPAPTATPVPPPPAAPPAPAVPPAAPVATGLNAMEADMFQRHNQQRAANGVAGLQVDASLVAIARQRAQDMAAQNYFSHTSPSGVTAFSLMDGAGYAYAIAGENIARNNYPDGESVGVAMDGFMNSAGHRENILDGRFTKVGIGVAFDASGMKYFAVVFAG